MAFRQANMLSCIIKCNRRNFFIISHCLIRVINRKSCGLLFVSGNDYINPMIPCIFLRTVHKEKTACHQESNRGHKDFQSFALPTELWHHCFSFAVAKVCILFISANFFSKKCSFWTFFFIWSKIMHIPKRFWKIFVVCFLVNKSGKDLINE